MDALDELLKEFENFKTFIIKKSLIILGDPCVPRQSALNFIEILLDSCSESGRINSLLNQSENHIKCFIETLKESTFKSEKSLLQHLENKEIFFPPTEFMLCNKEDLTPVGTDLKIKNTKFSMQVCITFHHKFM